MDIYNNLPDILLPEHLEYFRTLHDSYQTGDEAFGLLWGEVLFKVSHDQFAQILKYISEKHKAEYVAPPIEEQDAYYRAGVIHYMRDSPHVPLFEEYWHFVRYSESRPNPNGTYPAVMSYYNKDYMTDNEKFTFFDSADSPFAMCYPCRIELEGEVFLSASHYIAYAKAEIVRDRPKMKAILEETDIYRACALGREAKFEKAFYEFMIGTWMRSVLYAKFTQNEDLKQALLATEGTTLALTSDERYWSIGWHKGKRSEWRDQNILGELLTTVRISIAKKY